MWSGRRDTIGGGRVDSDDGVAGEVDAAAPGAAPEGFPDDVSETRPPMAPLVKYLAGDDPLMQQVDDLCYRTLHAPFGVARQEDWDNTDPDSLHVVAIDQGAVIGYARLIVEGHWAHVRQVVVEPAHRRCGVARILLDEVLAQAARMRLRAAYLNARLPAVPLYEGAGFNVVSKQPFAMPRTYLPHVRMERTLP